MNFKFFISLICCLFLVQCVQGQYIHEFKIGSDSPSFGGKDALAIKNTDTKTTWALHISKKEHSLQFFRDGALELKIMPDGSMNQISDINRKEYIADIQEGQLQNILQLRPKQYFFKNQKDNKLRFGLIAQEAFQIFPELVQIDNKDQKSETWSMNYIGIIPIVIKAMQEQNEVIVQQETEIEQLKTQLKKIESRLSALEVQVEKD